MICQCRLATLRTFVNGLVQVHKIEATAVPATAQLFSFPPATTQTRGFHNSRHASQREPEEGGGGEEATPSAASAPPPVKTRWRDLPPEELQKKIGRRDAWEKKKAARAENATERATEKVKIPQKSSTEPKSSKPKSAAPFSIFGSGKPNTPGASAPRTIPKMFKAPSTAQPEQQTSQAARPSSQQQQPPKWSATTPKPQQPKEDWRVQKAMLKAKFPDGWKPRKRLSPDALAGIRALNAQFPDVYTTQALADKFEMSAEAVRRILKSKWQPSEDEDQDRQERWHRRGMNIWETKAALGVKPPRKWREEGITRDPAYHARRRARVQRDQEWEDAEIKKYKDYRQSLQKAAGEVI